jgi:hypothetical protein
MYQIVDAVAATAEATEVFDALVVGMICVRSLQPSGVGRLVGKWGYGDQLWGDYPKIGNFLLKRTEEIRSKLGMDDKTVSSSSDMTYILEQNRGVMVSKIIDQ